MARPFQFSLRSILLLLFVISLVAWPSSLWLRAYLANRGLVPVKGLVTFKGQPLLAKVVLVPVMPGTKPVQGVTNMRGVFETETFAKPGDYTVAIIGLGNPRVPPRYTSAATSGIVVSVSATGQNDLAFSLAD